MSALATLSFAEGEAGITLSGLLQALEAGHRRPKARIADSFLERERETLLTRAAWIDGLGALVKTASIFPGNAKQGKPTVNGAVSLFSDQDGTLDAMIDFHLVTKWKTAADSLLAAQRLAPPACSNILIVGSGPVARSLVAGYGMLFPDAQVHIWSRTAQNALSVARDVPGLQVASDLRAAVEMADIVSCATLSTAPVIRGDWLRPGQHLDLIGAFRADMREADDIALRRSRIFVDSRDTTLGHIGELLIPLRDGVISKTDVLADFYDLDAFQRAPEDITLFKNGGGAHLDLMTSRYIFDQWTAGR